MENYYDLPLTGEQIAEKLAQLEVTTEGLKLANNISTTGNLEVAGNVTAQGKKLATEELATALTTEINNEISTLNTNVSGLSSTVSDLATTVSNLSTETWTFTLEDGSTVTKAVYVG